jgi:hypothetical protein
MSKRWSKLKREITKLWVESVNADIHEAVYKVGSSDVPRLYVTLNKEIIYDFWKDYKNERLGDWGVYPCDITKVSASIREYIDQPVEKLLTPIESDFTGITQILMSLDRRIGKEKLLAWEKNLHPEHPARKILDCRFPKKKKD